MKYLSKIFFVVVATAFSVLSYADVGDEGYVLGSAIWPSRDINVCWESTTNSSARDRGWVREAVEETWERYSRVKFQGWNQCPAHNPRRPFDGIRIQVADEGPRVQGGLGKNMRGRQNGMVLNFTFENWSPVCQSQLQHCIQAIAVHEFGHALGFAHEQNRPDTPTWCLEDQDPQGTDGTILVGSWDVDSIMNYCSPEWNNDGELSATDIVMVRQFYKKQDLVQSSYDDLPSFSADYYLKMNPDVANHYGRENYQGARSHWENSGKREGRRSSPGFHVKEYLTLNSDLKRAFGTDYARAIQHFKLHGIYEGRRTTYAFNVKQYLSYHADLRRNFGSDNYERAHIHWITNGVNEGRKSSSTFFLREYISHYSDLSEEYGNWNRVGGLIHWHKTGRQAGRDGLGGN